MPAAHDAMPLSAPPTQHRLRCGLTALTLVSSLVALILCAHPYNGLEQDSILYGLQALKHLYPAALEKDIFFQFGSQDNYTLFSPVYAYLIDHLGLETAAHLVARIGLVALVASTTLLARQLMGSALSWLSVMLFIAIPGTYGARNVLRYAENFATPRTITEAFVMCSLALLLLNRRRLALLATAVGFVLHPLMAVPAIFANVLFHSGRPRCLQLAILALAVTAIVLGVAIWVPHGSFILMDSTWYEALRSAVPYLLIEQWSLADWQPTAVALATLLLVLRALKTGPLSEIARIGVIIGMTGIALALFASKLPIALLIQGQPWRWLWLTKALAALALAPLLLACWHHRGLARTSGTLLVIAWLARNEAIGVVAALSALLTGMVATMRKPDAAAHAPALHRILPGLGYCLSVVLLVGLWRLHGARLEALLAFAVVGIWLLTFKVRHSSGPLLGMVAAIGLCTAQIAVTLSDAAPVDHPIYDAQTIDSFAAWRERIPEDATVFFPEHPETVWLALHRRSYTPYAALVFSRAAAIKDAQRVQLIDSLRLGYPSFGANEFFKVTPSPPDITTARLACGFPELDFIVTSRKLAATGLANSAIAHFTPLYLYSCKDLFMPLTP